MSLAMWSRRLHGGTQGLRLSDGPKDSGSLVGPRTQAFWWTQELRLSGPLSYGLPIKCRLRYEGATGVPQELRRPILLC